MQGRPDFGHISAGAVPFGDRSLPFQFQVGARDGVGVNQKLFRQDADGGDFIARSQPAGSDQVLQLVDNLNIDGHAIVGRNMDLHGISVSVY